MTLPTPGSNCLIIITVCTALASLAVAGASFAKANPAELNRATVVIYSDGLHVYQTRKNSVREQLPFIRSGVLFTSVRALATALAGSVNYESTNEPILLRTNSRCLSLVLEGRRPTATRLPPGCILAPFTLEVHDNVASVPLRWSAQSLGYDVRWQLANHVGSICAGRVRDYSELHASQSALAPATPAPSGPDMPPPASDTSDAMPKPAIVAERPAVVPSESNAPQFTKESTNVANEPSTVAAKHSSLSTAAKETVASSAGSRNAWSAAAIDTTIKLSMQGVTMVTPIVGLSVLALSLAFLYLFLQSTGSLHH